jgi:hypothetical protein
MRSSKQLDVLAGAVHGVVCALNLLAAGYNLLQGNKKRALFHTAVAVYEAHAVSLHGKEPS